MDNKVAILINVNDIEFAYQPSGEHEVYYPKEFIIYIAERTLNEVNLESLEEIIEDKVIDYLISEIAFDTPDWADFDIESVDFTWELA